MSLHDIELKKAEERLAAHGKDKDDFIFDVTHLPPDPDDVAMFTARYEVKITDRRTSKFLVVMGGIGLSWVGDFENALKDGHFD